MIGGMTTAGRIGPIAAESGRQSHFPFSRGAAPRLIKRFSLASFELQLLIGKRFSLGQSEGGWVLLYVKPHAQAETFSPSAKGKRCHSWRKRGAFQPS